MITRAELVNYLDDFLQTQKISDYCPNGLQIEGKTPIKKIITGVTACQQLIDQAIAEQADAVIVHHGFFWKNENPTITGIKQKRIAALLNKQINLLAYHLPLDIHPVVGNNAQLGLQLALTARERININGVPDLLYVGNLAEPMLAEDFATLITKQLARKPLHIKGSTAQIKTIAWCTGAAQDFINYAYQYDCDAYLTGEASEQTVHIARENDKHFFAAGHHATERYGIKALGEHLAQKFNLEQQFIDVDNPV